MEISCLPIQGAHRPRSGLSFPLFLLRSALRAVAEETYLESPSDGDVPTMVPAATPPGTCQVF